MLISDKAFQNKGDALLLSIDFAVEMLYKTDPFAIDIFYLIGMANHGLYLEDLKALFPSEIDKLTAYIQKLEYASLIEYD